MREINDNSSGGFFDEHFSRGRWYQKHQLPRRFNFNVVFKDYICDMIAKAPSLKSYVLMGTMGAPNISTKTRHLCPCHEPSYRSPEDFRKDATSAEEVNKPSNGIKECFLDEIIQTPIQVPIDAKHQVFLGCGKSMTTALVGFLTNISVGEDGIKNINCHDVLISMSFSKTIFGT